MLDRINISLQLPWTGIYVRLVAIALFYGSTVHLGNIFGLTGTPWLSTPLLWRSLDIILLIFNLVAGIGLWQHQVWSVVLLFAGILLLQWFPYIVWRSQFVLKPEDAQTLNGLIGTEAILLGLLLLLILLKK